MVFVDRLHITESRYTVDYIDKQMRSWSECADAKSDVGFAVGMTEGHFPCIMHQASRNGTDLNHIAYCIQIRSSMSRTKFFLANFVIGIIMIIPSSIIFVWAHTVKICVYASSKSPVSRQSIWYGHLPYRYILQVAVNSLSCQQRPWSSAQSEMRYTYMPWKLIFPLLDSSEKKNNKKAACLRKHFPSKSNIYRQGWDWYRVSTVCSNIFALNLF